MIRDVVVIGGGAAGYFAAINAARLGASVSLLEATRNPLTKVKISGGGRCNVTHDCMDPAELVKAYPRGAKELRSAFSRFSPRETIAWFQEAGVLLKTEADGRMFPVTNDSKTVVECLTRLAEVHRVEVRLGYLVDRCERVREQGGEEVWKIYRKADTDPLLSRHLLLATGGGVLGHELARSLGHQIEKPIPSLFTFQIDDERIKDLSGVSFSQVHLSLKVKDTNLLESQGPLLVTHWGLSGPSVLRLSAFAAIELYHAGYQADLVINFCPNLSSSQLFSDFWKDKEAHPRRSVLAHARWDVPKRFWQRLMEFHKIHETKTYADLSKVEIQAIVQSLHAAVFRIKGKGIFKEEFVTAGGIRRSEIDFRTMESKLCPGLFFAGEVIDIDGVTGGFNFQNAWTTAWIAAQELGQRAGKAMIAKDKVDH